MVDMNETKTESWKTRFARLGQFIKRKDGAVAVQFAILALPLTVLTFGLFDISRASIAKQQLQDALDAANLIAARSTGTTDAQLNAVGAPALTANLANLSDATLTASNFHANGAYIDATATVKVTPVIANLWLQGDMTISASSQVVRTMNKVEVALVLDNTGSMSYTLGSQTKIVALRSAATQLVDTLAAAAARSTDPNAVKISLVPFSMTVNVGTTYKTATWMSGTMPTAYGSDIFSNTTTNRFTMLTQTGLTWGGCVESRPAPYDIQETAPSSGTPATMFVPYFAPDEPDDNTISYTSGGHTYYYDFDNNWITNDKTTTTGSTLATVKTRQGRVQKYAASNTGNIASGANGTGDFGPNRECNIQPIMRLTNNFSALKTRIAALGTGGNTNVPMGLVWGWHMISPNGPFADGATYGTQNLTKIIVLLTDGDNTNDEVSNPQNSIYTGVGYAWQARLLSASNVALTETSTGTQRRDALDDREAKLCANIKARGIIIYSIGVGVSSHSQSILQACASSPDKYYNVTDAADLSSTFNAIAGSIQNLRISH